MPDEILNRAYSIFEIKSIDDEKRTIEGIATTPTPDRLGDIVDPKGVTYSLPLPLLHQHDHSSPVGHVISAKATRNGITFKAQLAKSEPDDPPSLKERLDVAWAEVKKKLVRGVSIGFKPVRDAIEFMEGGGLKFTEWEWLELSLVTIPANMDATITSIKSMDQAARAATGTKSKDVQEVLVRAASGHVESAPGDSGKRVTATAMKGATTMAKKTLAEQRSAFEATRAAKAARLAELAEKSGEEGVTLAADEKEEFDTLADEIKEIDDHLSRLAIAEKAAKETLKPVAGASAEDASAARGGAERIRVDVRNSLPKGTAFTRYVMAMAQARGNPPHALAIAKKWEGQTPEVGEYIKALHMPDMLVEKAEPGTVYSPGGSPSTWGGAFLTYPTNLAAEFVELLYPATLMGRMNGWRRIPFNVRVGVQDGGSTVNWVGEAAAKPVTELSFTEALMTLSKIAGIVVLTDELVRLSTPSAEDAVRTDLVRSIAKFIDEQMLDASVTANNVRPASLTNGVSAVSASGYDADALYVDLNAALAGYDNAETGIENIHVLMTPATARSISTIRNPLGQFEFTGVTPQGGQLLGFPVLVSNSVPDNTIVLVKTDEVWIADDGNVSIDASREATLDMSGGNSPAFSLFQKNCVAIRAERWIRWQKRRASAVQLITGALYNPTGESPTG